jgi:hypothetical protein
MSDPVAPPKCKECKEPASGKSKYCTRHLEAGRVRAARSRAKVGAAREAQEMCLPTQKPHSEVLDTSEAHSVLQTADLNMGKRQPAKRKRSKDDEDGDSSDEELNTARAAVSEHISIGGGC